MPKFEPKNIQQELKDGLVWPVYWLYGQEKMKSRELLKRIRKAVLGDALEGAAAFGGFAEESLDGTETEGIQVLESAQSLSLGGGTRLIIVRNAHALKNPEPVAELFGQKAKPCRKEDLGSVCVFLSKDLDGRKKFSKLLVEKAAVVSCEEVPEAERGAWIQYLSKARGLQLPQDVLAQLESLEPWSLDVVDQELEKLTLSEQDMEVLLGGAGLKGGADAFLSVFLSRDFRKAYEYADTFAESPDEALPFLGLLGWNVRHLALFCQARDGGRGPAPKLNPYVEERMRSWQRHWKLDEILELQRVLAELDFDLKQTPKLPLGLWTSLVLRFGKQS